MPQLGESIAEATVIRLLVGVGDPVQTGQDIIEVETSKAAMNLAGFVGGIPRRPLLPLAAGDVATLREFLTREGLLS